MRIDIKGIGEFSLLKKGCFERENKVLSQYVD